MSCIPSLIFLQAGAGKKVNLEKKVDPSILGGLQIQMGERFLDLSVASRVSRLSADLDGAA
jgi:F-type H+-transporting ATPase subunit O